LKKEAYKEIKLCDQPRLSLGRTVRIAIDGVRYRLFRAAVTVCVIAVAVAFLMNILSESLIKRRLAAEARQDLAELRTVHRWAARLSRPAQPEAIIAATAAPDAPGSFISSLGDGDVQERFMVRARAAAAYLAFFDGLDYDTRRTLIHTTRGVAIFDALRQPERLTAFASRLAEMSAVQFIVPLEAFRAFLDDWPELASDLEQVIAAQKMATDKLNAVRGRRTVFEVLARDDGTFAAAVRGAGFRIDPDTMALLGKQARAVLDKRVVERSLALLDSRQFLAQQYDLLPADVSPNELWRFLEKQNQATAYLEAIAPLDSSLAPYRAARLVELAEGRATEQALERVERLTAGAGTGWLGLGERMAWLLTVSMLVCAIGISNAMLMTVTERFREIATMKCLGALDGFIMLLFVLESCFLGLAGGVIGSILGDLIGYGRMVAIFGLRVVTAVSPGELLSAMGSAVGVGVVLAAVAAVYPSLKAARLAPMEAMRVE
jgi:putative ABC transport system permease protein